VKFTTYTEVDGCLTCLDAAIAGIYAEPVPEGTYAAAGHTAASWEAATREGFGEGWAFVDIGDITEHFTWTPCDLCGSTLAGERYGLVIRHAAAIMEGAE
jgi:hypothetical protein